MFLFQDNGAATFSGTDNREARKAQSYTQNALAMAMSVVGQRRGAHRSADGLAFDVKADSADNVIRLEKLWSETQTVIFEMARPSVAGHIYAQAQRYGVKIDAFAPAQGMFGNQDLVQQWAKVYEMKTKPIMWDRTFIPTNVIATGAEQYRISTTTFAGQAQKYRVGTPASNVAVGLAQVDRPMHTFATVSNMTWQLTQQSRFAGYDIPAALISAHRTGHMLTADQLFFQGASDYDVWGLANYPDLAKYDTGLSIAALPTGAQLAQAFMGAVKRPMTRSGTTFWPDTLDIAPEIEALASATFVVSANPMTVVQWFQEQVVPDGSGRKYKLRINHRLSAMTIGATSNLYGMFAHGDMQSTFDAEFMPPLYIPGPMSEFTQDTYVVSRNGGLFNPYPTGAELAFMEA